MTTTVMMEFDLEDQLDSVMDNMEASGIMGTARGESLAYYALNVYSKRRNLWQNATEEGSWARFVFHLFLALFRYGETDVRSTENA